MGRTKFVIVVIHGSSPIWNGFASEQRQQTSTLHHGRERKSDHVKHRGRIVDIYGPLLANTSGLHQSRKANHPRNPQCLLIHEPLVKPTMFSKEKAMVARVDHDRAIRQAAAVQKLQEPPYVLILRSQRSEKV